VQTQTPEILDMSRVNSIPSCVIHHTKLVMDILFFSFLQVQSIVLSRNFTVYQAFLFFLFHFCDGALVVIIPKRI
jgi:hypothetical protein